MVYTEVRDINGRKYFYRVTSRREGGKIKKKRIMKRMKIIMKRMMKNGLNFYRYQLTEKIAISVI